MGCCVTLSGPANAKAVATPPSLSASSCLQPPSTASCRFHLPMCFLIRRTHARASFLCVFGLFCAAATSGAEEGVVWWRGGGVWFECPLWCCSRGWLEPGIALPWRGDREGLVIAADTQQGKGMWMRMEMGMRDRERGRVRQALMDSRLQDVLTFPHAGGPDNGGGSGGTEG